MDSSTFELCKQIDHTKRGSVDRCHSGNSGNKLNVKTRFFYRTKNTISPPCNSTKRVLFHRTQRTDKHNMNANYNRFAVLGSFDEQEINQFLLNGDKIEQDRGTGGVKGTVAHTSGHNVVIPVTKINDSDSSYQGMVLQDLNTEVNTTSRMQDKDDRLCDKSEELSSRDIFPCVQSDDYSEFCKKSVLDRSRNNHTLGDFSPDKTDTWGLTCNSPTVEGSQRDFCKTKAGNCTCNSHDNGGCDTNSCTQVALSRRDTDQCSEMHLSVDLTKSHDIIRATKLGKDTIKKVNVYTITDKCADLQQCLKQQKNALGFLPINNLAFAQHKPPLKPKIVITEKTYDPVTIHRFVRNTGKYNFQDARILLPSKINFELFEKLAQDYWDWQLPHFIKDGFPLDFPYSQETLLKDGLENHSSATKFPEHVDNYLQTELTHGAIIGPFSNPPYGEDTHISPFMSRDKQDSDNRRIIIDLSWPIENSINYFTPSNIYLDTVYKLQYPTVDNITETLRKLGEDAVLYKIDLSRAFRQLHIDPSDFNLLCLKWRGLYYSDQYCPFGHRSGSMAMTRLTSFFRFLMTQQGYCMHPYVDDMIGCASKADADNQCNFLLGLLERLGFPISSKKLVRPTHLCNCLGIMIDTHSKTLFISHEKQQEIIEKCNHVQSQKTITKKQLQSVIGSIMFIHKCVKSCRYFTNRLLNALRESTSNNITVDNNVQRDIAWFQAFMPTFNGLTTYDHMNPECHESIEIDACLVGMGGVWGNKVYTTPIPEELQLNSEFNITQYEMMNILVALRVWGHLWRHHRVVFKVDNLAVVMVCNKGYTKCKHLGAMIRNIWLVAAIFDIEISVIHIPGK